ncbi:MAG: PaaI family thioesterase [Gammaproteobacteria bacterium]|nr:PaaI family thioesterase [Gammaproteobacteria bacterium]MDH5799423.1 PaaI family thioesterase [Gammaproteobacteria bacterium]
MANEILNKSLFPHNTCYGCGHDNINGLKIEIIKDPANPKSLLAEFNAREYMEGLPGLTHSGAIFTAMDCLATWTAKTLLPHYRAIWMTQSCNVSYLSPAFIDQPLLMSGRVLEAGKDWETVIIYTEAKDSSGKPVSTAETSLLPLTAEKYLEITDGNPLPEYWDAYTKTQAQTDIA